MKKLLTLFLLTAMFLTACSKPNTEINNSSTVSTPSETVTSQDVAPPVNLDINPFTGVASDAESLLNRPLAVMVNNIEPALPQSGIGTADIVVEMPVEGSATRLMAVYADYTKLPTIGSIRSSRHDFVEFIEPFDPIYLHFGYSDAAKESIAANNIENINGIQVANIAFYQDKEKLKHKASEHTWFSNLEYLNAGISNKGYQTKLTERIAPMFKFAEGSAMATYADAVDMTSAKVVYSGGANAQFDYDAATGMYVKQQNGKPHLDENLGEACKVKNILVMYTDVPLMADQKHKDVNLASGVGYYISEGKRIDVTFKKDSVDSYLKVFDKTGEELKLNVGNSWICISPIGNKDK